ncbi:MAG TPA: hypothetical protein VMG38_04630 [Trebonia sp.]|nr:hypothetical protein [Trebonia sp.]
MERAILLAVLASLCPAAGLAIIVAGVAALSHSHLIADSGGPLPLRNRMHNNHIIVP